jgi:hypothetical protein
MQQNHDRLNWIYDVHLLLAAMTEDEQVEFSRLALQNNLQTICREMVAQSRQCFGTKVSKVMLNSLEVPALPKSFKTRFAASHTALLTDDFRLLPDRQSRLDFLREFFFPPADYLLNRYKKKSRLWLFPLYIRYLFGGLYERLALH